MGQAPQHRRKWSLSARAFAALAAALVFSSPLPAAQAAANDPLTLVVSLEDQRLAVYRGAEKVFTSPVSTGRQGYPTPAGVFSILQKRRWHRSNIYSQAPMPFMQRLTWSGIALHAGRLPGYPASHGCIRLPNEQAEALFGLTGLGAHVVVHRNEVAPLPIRHPVLFQPSPPLGGDGLPQADIPAPRMRLAAGTPLLREVSDAADPPETEIVATRLARRADAQEQARRAYASRPREPLRIYVSRRTGRERIADMQMLLAELGHDPGGIDGLMGPNTSAAIRSFQRSIGLSPTGAFSEDLVKTLYHATGVADPAEAHLYVRQGLEPLFEAPVRLREPERPLGTHLFTALHFDDGARQARWVAVPAGDTAAASASQALDRIDIPPAIRARISRLLTSGSSLIVSDQGLGLETARRGTDFIVIVD